MPGPRDRARPYPGSTDLPFYIESDVGERFRRLLPLFFLMLAIAFFIFVLRP